MKWVNEKKEKTGGMEEKIWKGLEKTCCDINSYLKGTHYLY